jgi:Rrf2 family protein
MPTSSRFAVALHVLVALAHLGEEGSTSADLAKSVNTNPVVVRRILGALVKAGVVTGRGGRSGGYHLARDPRKIGLDRVLQVVEPEGFFAMHENPSNPACAVSCSIKQVLGVVFERAEASMHAPLREISVADLLRRVSAAR